MAQTIDVFNRINPYLLIILLGMTYNFLSHECYMVDKWKITIDESRKIFQIMMILLRNYRTYFYMLSKFSQIAYTFNCFSEPSFQAIDCFL
ncbi:Hypothetical protein PYTT_2386 [Akkermansia glycaniphila]|uniref:Uncharacterized protein n=1 Tax=Akkermansia glycaniphila TaxID=1679444 RepID=A0A1C7P9M8_9BACT|nr:hypothetical protein AC781_11560 [Akkermansia glycaniphila]SEH99386.1 Hypothetical protein PYTT_2386 [Akkermansia glycaniphila]